jgi:hypothetical protein
VTIPLILAASFLAVGLAIYVYHRVRAWFDRLGAAELGE